MTRDEAIYLLKQIYTGNPNDKDALNMAIEALEDRKCGDCKWLCGNKSTVGIECLHPDRPFMPNCSDVARYKYKASKACKKFERKEKL